MNDTSTPNAFERIQRGRHALAGFVQQVFDTTPVVVPEGETAADRRRAGSDHIPVRIVEGFIASAADHLKAWLRASELLDEGDPEPLLHLYADHTLWRAILEAVASAVWILGPDDQDERIRRATKLALYEWAETGPIERQGHPADDVALRMKDELRRIIERVCTQMGWEIAEVEKRRISPSTVLNAARNHLGPAGQDIFYWWTVCSRYAHGQTLTMMLRARRQSAETPYGDVVNVTTDAELVAELIEFTLPVLNVLIQLTWKRGLLRADRGGS